MKRLLVLFLFAASAFPALSQTYLQYNSRTLFDASENPVSKAFYADTSRRFAFNFFLPTITSNAAFTGEGNVTFKSMIFEGVTKTQDLAIGEGKVNRLVLSGNTYLVAFRMLKGVKYNKELGITWQVRNDGNFKITNESLGIFGSVSRFTQTDYADIFNNSGYNVSYHQFAFNYREDLNKRLSVGVKLSYLSGITYNRVNVSKSAFSADTDNDSYDIYLKGRYRSNIGYNEDFDQSYLNPGFQNPGAAITLGMSYKFRGGYYLMANVKDLGGIKWNNELYQYDLDQTFTVNQASQPGSISRLKTSLRNTIRSSVKQTGFLSPINSKAEILINKDYNNYQPNLILSKSLFNYAGDLVLVNNYHVKNMVFSLSTGYNTAKYLGIGAQFMVKNENTEFFIGSDQLFKTVNTIKAASASDASISTGHTAASFNIGFSAKFGPVLEHMMNASRIPGIDNPREGEGFFRRIFHKRGKSKKYDNKEPKF